MWKRSHWRDGIANMCARALASHPSDSVFGVFDNVSEAAICRLRQVRGLPSSEEMFWSSEQTQQWLIWVCSPLCACTLCFWENSILIDVKCWTNKTTAPSPSLTYQININIFITSSCARQVNGEQCNRQIHVCATSYPLAARTTIPLIESHDARSFIFLTRPP